MPLPLSNAPMSQAMSRFEYLTKHIVSSIGFRLTLLLAGGLALYLIVAGFSISALLQQKQGLKELSGLHYERALTAAELSRDAEVIAAQTFENILSTNRSVTQEGALNQDLVDLYHYVRNQLTATNEIEQGYIDEIDRWQKPYFESLDKLALRMEEERRFAEQEQALLLKLIQTNKQIQTSLSHQQESLSYTIDTQDLLAAQNIINTCLIALKSEKNGQLHQLQQQANQILSNQLMGQPKLQRKLSLLVQETFDLRKPLTLSHRATLSSAREARLYAQRLTTSSYNYFQSLKSTAHKAARNYEQAVQHALILVAFFSILFLISIFLTVMFIRRRLVDRLDHLSDIMSAHVAGDPKAIPTQGDDEISVIGQAFEVFVDARNHAEQRLNQAQTDTQQANNQLRRLNRQLLILSETDPLTETANRRYFDQRLQDNWQIALNLQQPLALIMCDIDQFKSYNDHYGHQAGDICLKQIAKTLTQVVKDIPDSLLGRYGGEKFIILTPDSTEEQAAGIAEKLRLAIIDMQLKHEGSEYQVVTLSLGVSSTIPSNEKTLDRLIQQADNALYKAKGYGRNRTAKATLLSLF